MAKLGSGRRAGGDWCWVWDEEGDVRKIELVVKILAVGEFIFLTSHNSTYSHAQPLTSDEIDKFIDRSEET